MQRFSVEAGFIHAGGADIARAVNDRIAKRAGDATLEKDYDRPISDAVIDHALLTQNLERISFGAVADDRSQHMVNRRTQTLIDFAAKEEGAARAAVIIAVGVDAILPVVAGLARHHQAFGVALGEAAKANDLRRNNVEQNASVFAN